MYGSNLTPLHTSITLTTSGFKAAGKAVAASMASHGNVERVAQKFTHPTVAPGKKDLKIIRFHFDLSDQKMTIPDTRLCIERSY